MAGRFELDKVLSNSKARVLIALPNNKTITSFMTAPLSLGGANEFTKPFDSDAVKSLDIKSRMLAQASTAGGGLLSDVAGSIGNAIGSVTNATAAVRTVFSTISTWTGSANPVFNLQLAFVALREDDDVTEPCKQLFEASLPTFTGDGLTARIRPPLGYGDLGSSNRSAVKGTIALQLGDWFKASMLLLNTFEFTFSEQYISSGLPLFATASATFEPYRMLSSTEMISFFRSSQLNNIDVLNVSTVTETFFS